MRSARLWALVLGCAAALAACGGAERSATAAKVASPASARTADGGAHALALANQVCRAVRAGAPARLPRHLTAQGLARYVNAARPAAQRVTVSLQRLGRSHRIAGLDRIVAGYTQLRAAYAAAAAGRAPRAARREIASREAAVSAAARSARLFACSAGTP